MKKYLVIISLLVAFCGFLNETIVAQQQQKPAKSRKGKINNWTKTADNAFKNERYFKAFGYYDRAFRREKEGSFRMHLRERLGETQRRLNNPVESVLYFYGVWESGNREKEFMTSYADVLLKTANYEKAEMLYEMLYKQDTTNVFITNRLESAKLGLAYSDTLDVVYRDQIRNQYRLSTPFSQYGMVIVDGKLVYSSAQRVKPAATDQRTGHGFSHLYQATLRQDSLLWENPQPLSFNIWGAHINDGVFSYDPVNKIGYFQRCNEGNCGIFTTTFENDVWTVPQKFEMNGVAATNVVGHPAISPDGKRLIFITRAPEGEGGSDLWMTTKVERPAATTSRRRTATTTQRNPATSSRAGSAATRQTERQQAAPPSPAQARTARGRSAAPAVIMKNQDWDVPVNLGKAVNSSGDEVFPIWINDSAIAFSSNGRVGYGGLDIYVAIADAEGKFTNVKHVEAPINSSFDDYTLVISPDIAHIFFSSSREKGFGHSDEIYSFPKTASILEFQFTVTDLETNAPLANTTVTVCYPDTCRSLTTDSLGKAKLITPKTANDYDITFDKENYYKETRLVSINPALSIIPLRDVQRIEVAIYKDTTQKIEFDPIPAKWEFLTQNLEDDLADVLAVVALDTLAQLLGLNNTCVENLVITLTPTEDYTQVGELRAMDVPLVSSVPLDSADTCKVYYHEKEAFFAIPIVVHTSGEFQIPGTISYTVGRPDSTFVFRNVPFVVPVVGKAKEKPFLAARPEEEEIPVVEMPPVTWYYSVNQVRGSEEADLIMKAIIRPDVFMISHIQRPTEDFSSPTPRYLSTQRQFVYDEDSLSQIVFRYDPDPEKYDLTGAPRMNVAPLSLTPESDPSLTNPILVFIDSVTFTQKIQIRSPRDFRITGKMDYALGFDRAVEMITDSLNPDSPNNYKHYTDVPLSFPIFGIEIPEVLATVEEEEIDLSWAEGIDQIETPVFTHYISVNECDSINLMIECMKPGMTPEQIINCIDAKRRECEERVDTRFIENYKDRINDPNRRANLTRVPPGTPCVDCDKEPQRHNSKEPLFIQATDDKQTLRFTDNAGNTTFFDLAPNTRYEIAVHNFVNADVAALPDHINVSDIIKTVTTKDYVIYECMPKLSEIGDELYVNNIYYDFDKDGIIKDGHRELDRLIIIAIKNPHLKFEITSHTDERGSTEYNQALSERRLNTVLDYVRRKGMDAARLITNAIGKSDPLIVNAQTEAEHALNRRTTIRLYDPNATNDLAPSYELAENNPLNKSGLWFRVQIGAYREAPEYPLYLFSEYIKAAQGTELTFYHDRDGLFKFTMGETQDLNEARRLNQRILDANLETYVVAFMDGQRITIAEARAIMGRQARR
jgi:outer membrane protein OmpA-like peptidoglycan-associated protein